MVNVNEIDDIILDLGRALETARRAKRIAEVGKDPEGALRTCRTTALVAVRLIARHYPPARQPARV